MRWREALKGMTPYTPGRSIEEVKELYGLEEVVKLASNENPYGVAPAVKQQLATRDIDFEIYPDGYAGSLRKQMAAKLNVSEQNLLFGSGSDEIIVIIARALLGPGTNTLAATPTFPQYGHHAKIEGSEVREIPLVDGAHNLDGFLEAIDENTSVIWLCSPNNPTGNLLDHEVFMHFLNQIRQDILVVMDEAYFEYIVDENYVDTVNLIEDYPNLLVLRTFSKAYGLAAFRVGYAVGNPTVIANLDTARSPFNVTSASLLLAEKALEDQAFIEECKRENRQQMTRFVQYASKHQLHIFDSQANFVLIEVPGSAADATEKLLQQGYIVRSGDALGVPGHIRVTVGTPAQNDGFFKAFDRLLEGVGQLK